MADPKTKKKRLSLGKESAFSTTTFPTVREWPFLELGDLTDAKGVIPTARHTGRTGVTAMEPGPDNGSTSGKLEVVGFASEVGDGASPPSADYFDDFLEGFARLDRTEDGEGATVSGTGVTLDSAGDAVAGDLIPLKDDTTGEVRFVPVASGSGASLTLAFNPNFDIADVMLGHKTYRDDDGDDNSVSFAGIFEQDSDQFDCHGMKLTAVNLSVTPEANALFEVTFGIDRMDVGGSETPPAFVGNPTATPQRIGRVWLDGTEVDVASIEVDFGVDAQPRASTKEATGRSEHLHMATNPSVTIVPVYTDAHRNLKRNQTVQSLVIQIGDDLGFYAPRVQVQEAAPTDASGLQRQTLTLTVLDPASSTLDKWQVVRC